MKIKVLVITLLFCGVLSFGQSLFKEIDSRSGGIDLVGNFSPDLLKATPFSEWYQTFYDYHELDTKEIEDFKTSLSEYQILLFMGTWCSDSQREVPALMKILEKADFPTAQLKIVGVYDKGPNYKTSPNGEHWGLRITNVPTIIFLKDGKEVNRIVESPLETLEKDMAKVFSGEEYVPNYAVKTKSP
ncbi:MAG: thioredoxin family protein [Flavobacteriaceae bacterium]